MTTPRVQAFRETLERYFSDEPTILTSCKQLLAYIETLPTSENEITLSALRAALGTCSFDEVMRSVAILSTAPGAVLKVKWNYLDAKGAVLREVPAQERLALVENNFKVIEHTSIAVSPLTDSDKLTLLGIIGALTSGQELRTKEIVIGRMPSGKWWTQQMLPDGTAGALEVSTEPKTALARATAVWNRSASKDRTDDARCGVLVTDMSQRIEISFVRVN